MMGKITCANVLSDIYATGVTNIDNLSLIISVCENMTEEDSGMIMPLIIKGFQHSANTVNLKVDIKSAVYNPWCIIGGTATAVCTADEYISPLQAQIGDVIILTKPLGAQIACNANRWCENKDRWEKLKKAVTMDQIKAAYRHAVLSMTRLNKKAAELMHKYKAHATTDITGFGILGHCKNLARFQKTKVKLVIHTLPVIKDVLAVAEAMGSKQKFLNGTTPETSGGLLICMSKDAAKEYCSELYAVEGWNAWIIGEVQHGENEAIVVLNPTIIEAEFNR